MVLTAMQYKENKICSCNVKYNYKYKATVIKYLEKQPTREKTHPVPMASHSVCGSDECNRNAWTPTTFKAPRSHPRLCADAQMLARYVWCELISYRTIAKRGCNSLFVWLGEKDSWLIGWMRRLEWFMIIFIGVVDAGYTGVMSPALCVSLPSIPHTNTAINNLLQLMRGTETSFSASREWKEAHLCLDEHRVHSFLFVFFFLRLVILWFSLKHVGKVN